MNNPRTGFVLVIAAALLASAISQSAFATAAPRTEAAGKAVIADAEMLELAGAKILAVEPSTRVAFARIDASQEEKLSALSHERGRCAGFETLPESEVSVPSLQLQHVFGQLAEQELKNRRFRPATSHFAELTKKAEIETAVNEVSEANVQATVEFLSSFASRDHKGSDPNGAINAFKQKIEQVMAGATVPYQIDVITHRGIRQNSLRVRIPGADRPDEIVVLGGHIDSINHEWFGSREAPGADDNASGSADILEALRVVSRKAQPQRTIEFFWYAGEEGGLLGSAEIAKDYKAAGKQVVGVLQLDMTLFPGSGEFVLGSMTDFTSVWFRSYLENLNTLYIKAKIVNDKCGYGCSDHASWHRQGYPALMPFEASFSQMNKNLHTTKDRIDSQSNFRHAAMFAKIAVAIALDLGNSTLKETP